MRLFITAGLIRVSTSSRNLLAIATLLLGAGYLDRPISGLQLERRIISGRVLSLHCKHYSETYTPPVQVRHDFDAAAQLLRQGSNNFHAQPFRFNYIEVAGTPGP